jgi:putative DNA primase/helicase
MTCQLQPVAPELLKTFADSWKEPPAEAAQKNGYHKANSSKLLMERFLQARGIEFREKSTKGPRNCTVWIIKECPFDASHGAGKEVCVTQEPNGKNGFKCMHDSCTGRGWKDFKEKIGKPDPDHYDPPLKPPGTKSRKRKRLVIPEPTAFEKQTPVVGGFPLTDYGNAQRLVAQHAGMFRYCYLWKKALEWCGTHWRLDYSGAIERMAKATVRNIYREAEEGETTAERVDLAEWACKSEDANRINAMIAKAWSEPGISIQPDEMDRDPWLLNCKNGTLDLRTGQIREHLQEDGITKLCPVHYDPAASCPRWEAFLRAIFQDKAELIAYVQRLLGYCLTGDVSEQILPIFHGSGANGKSTLLGIILKMLGGDYAIKAATDLLMVKRSEAHPTEKADLFGRRIAVCIETEEDRQLAESLIKDLTGGDRQRARRMREDFWEFDPTHKVILCTNHKPIIVGTDPAIWRRPKMIPFSVYFWDPNNPLEVENELPPEFKQDKQLSKKLATEFPGILAWCVRGCLDWQRGGLRTPAEVEAATTDYRNEQDVVAAFFLECCHIGPDYRTTSAKLYGVYRLWCEESGEKDCGGRRFGRAMSERPGVERYTDNGTKYRGVAPRTEWLNRFEQRNQRNLRNPTSD